MKDIFLCMAESLHCSPETITTLLISNTPLKNKKFFFFFFFLKRYIFLKKLLGNLAKHIQNIVGIWEKITGNSGKGKVR